MKIITDARCTAYASPGHPEEPGRITRTVNRLKHQTALPLEWRQPGPLGEALILRAHSAEMVRRLEVAQPFDLDTPYFEGIGERARASAAAALLALALARSGENVFSLMRPPGDHATREQSMGFCYLNNVAIAALEAVAGDAKQVAVFDFDVHHGNGTEDILLNQPGWNFLASINTRPIPARARQIAVGIALIIL